MIRQRLTNRFRLLVFFLVVAMLLPVYGSWIKVDYAAQQPNHKHIYMGKVNLNHHRTAETKGIVILPDQDATSQIVVMLDLPNEQISVNTADSENFIFDLADGYLSPENNFLPPPDRPPRI